MSASMSKISWGQLGQVAAYFNYWQGGPLKNFDSAYRTQDGHVAAHINFIPQSVSRILS
jgi:hypothetical protein